MYGLDFDHADVAPDHMVTNLGFGVLVTCPSAPSDPQQPQWGRCQVCGTSLRDRTYPDPEQV